MLSKFSHRTPCFPRRKPFIDNNPKYSKKEIREWPKTRSEEKYQSTQHLRSYFNESEEGKKYKEYCDDLLEFYLRININSHMEQFMAIKRAEDVDNKKTLPGFKGIGLN